jgi:hypothetical protein
MPEMGRSTQEQANLVPSPDLNLRFFAYFPNQDAAGPTRRHSRWLSW